VLSEQGTDLSRAAIEAIALEGYRSRRLSTGQVRRLLGFATRIRVHEFLKEHGVYLHYSAADIEQDRKASMASEEKRKIDNPHAA
jgi:hypothetical protein